MGDGRVAGAEDSRKTWTVVKHADIISTIDEALRFYICPQSIRDGAVEMDGVAGVHLSLADCLVDEALAKTEDSQATQGVGAKPSFAGRWR